MIGAALIVLAIAVGWTALAIVVGIGFGRAIAANDADAEARREVERLMRRRGYAGELNVASAPRRSAPCAHEPMVHEQPDELRARRHL